MDDEEAENTQLEQQQQQQPQQRIQNNEDSVKSLWDNFKHTNICIMGVLEGEERKQEIESLFEKIMAGSFCNLVKEIDIQVQEVQKIPHKMNPKRPTPKQIITKMPKV